MHGICFLVQIQAILGYTRPLNHGNSIGISMVDHGEAIQKLTRPDLGVGSARSAFIALGFLAPRSVCK